MGSVCADEHRHHSKLHHVLSPNKCLQAMNIPPRKKLLSRRSDDYYSYSPIKHLHEEALMHKFLPHNGDDEFDDDDDADPYSSDEFRMYEFKIRKCSRSRSHDWTDCPFSHPGEKAKRRDPRRFQYSGTVCPEYSRCGSCAKGDDCEFAHGVFECWLHPARYRTEACKDGKNCKRKVCFFAHSPRELRVLPLNEDGDDRDLSGSKPDRCTHTQHCCRHCCPLSPTSTLLSRSHFSPPLSPSTSLPLSPLKTVGLSGLSPMSRYSSSGSRDSLGMRYEDMVINELLGSVEGMRINEAIANLKSSGTNKVRGGLWVDVSYDKGEDHIHFTHSPSTPINPPSLFRNIYTSNNNQASGSPVVTIAKTTNALEKEPETGMSGPDLGWVNDLLM